MSKLSLKNNLLNVTIHDRSIVCPHQALDRQNIFSLLNIFSGREKDAGVRLCPRRRSEAPGTRRALGPDPDGAGDLVTSFARIRGGGARNVRGLRRRCSGWGGVGAQSSWPSAPPPWSWWTSAARPPPGAACHTHRDTQVGDIRDINDTCDTDTQTWHLWHYDIHTGNLLTRVHFVDDSNELQSGHCTLDSSNRCTFYIDTFPCGAV